MALSKLLMLLVVLLGAVYYVDAHGWMTDPKPRGQYLGKRSDQEFAPAALDPMDPNMVCRGDNTPIPESQRRTLVAGQKLNINVEYNAKHPGDCFVYLTYDGALPDAQKKWFKIWQKHECDKNDMDTITIPSYLPSASHAIIRWEWYALHVMDAGRGTVEFYVQCADAFILGASNGRLPQPQVNIPGHLPKLDSSSYWDPYNSRNMFFTGPALATVDGVIPPTPTTAPTQKPTSAPTQKPTSAPTQRPTPATPAPTQRPPTAPTTRPSNPTVAPTNPPPVATPAPTSAPTRPPASTGSGSNCRPKRKRLN